MYTVCRISHLEYNYNNVSIMPMYVIFQRIMRVTELSIEINKTLRNGHSRIIIVVIIVIEIIIHNSVSSRVHINIVITMH